MIALAARPRAARVTVLILLAATLRGISEPLGAAPSTALFAGCLIAILLFEAPRRAPPQRRSTWGRAAVAGLAIGMLLVAPLAGHGLSARPLDTFWIWGAVVVVIATLEEAVLRGTLQCLWTEEAGVAVGMAASALVFALIHLPRYGLAALPLDIGVGLSLAGLRAVTGRIVGCAVAHVIADWGAWFLG